MSTIIPFQFETHALRVQVDDANQPWFNANDVCEALQLGNARQALESHVDADDGQKLDTIDSLGRTQRANHVNETGRYALHLAKRTKGNLRCGIRERLLPCTRRMDLFGSPRQRHCFAPSHPVYRRWHKSNACFIVGMSLAL